MSANPARNGGPVALEYVPDPTAHPMRRLLGELLAFVLVLLRVPVFTASLAYAWWVSSWAEAHGPALPVVLVVVLVVALVVWRVKSPASFARYCSRPVLASVRRVFVYWRHWQPAMVTTGLAVRPWSKAETLPRLGRVRRTACGDVVLARMLPGQTVEDWASEAGALAQTFNATACRVTAVAGRPRWVRLAFTTRDALAGHVAPMTAAWDGAPSGDSAGDVVDLEAVPVAVSEDGDTYRMPVLYAHTLVAGETGSGKGSVVWSLRAGVAPAIRSGRVQVWAIDPKGGMELSPGAGLFARFAYGEPVPGQDGTSGAWQADMVDLLEHAVHVMQERAARLRGVTRKHVPTTSEPLILVVVDELASLTAYVTDTTVRKRLHAALGLLLTQGRAVGVSVVGATPDARKETLSLRDLFSRRIALRTAEPEMGDLILGRGARARGALTDQIPHTTPGVAYVACDGVPEPVRVRFTYLTDQDITALAWQYGPRASWAAAASSTGWSPNAADPAARASAPSAPVPVPVDVLSGAPLSDPAGAIQPAPVAAATTTDAGQRRPRSPRTPRAARLAVVPGTTASDGQGES